MLQDNFFSVAHRTLFFEEKHFFLNVSLLFLNFFIILLSNKIELKSNFMKRFLIILSLILFTRISFSQEISPPNQENELVIRENTRDQIVIRKDNNHQVTFQLLTNRLRNSDKILRSRNLELQSYRLQIMRKQMIRQQRLMRQKTVDRYRRMLNR